MSANPDIALAADFTSALLRQFPSHRSLEPQLFAMLAARCQAIGAEIRCARRDLIRGLPQTLPNIESQVSQALARLEEKFLPAIPAVPPYGVIWRMRRERVGKEVEVYFSADMCAAEPLPNGPSAGIRTGHTAFVEFSAVPAEQTVTSIRIDNCHIMCAATAESALSVNATASSVEWRFPGGLKEQQAFHAAVTAHWTGKIAQGSDKSRAKPRVWDGRLWGIDETVINQKKAQVTFMVSRIRYRTAAFLYDHWSQPVPPAFCPRNTPRGGYPELLGLPALNSPHTPAPVSLLRLGVVVYLRKSRDFVITRFRDAPASLAGRGMMFSLMTPESDARPRPVEQVTRRLVEDLGLAVMGKAVEFIGYARFAAATIGITPQPFDHVVFAQVSVDLDRDQLLELFQARRYDQFVDAPDFVPDSTAIQQLATHNPAWDSLLHLGLCLSLVRSGRLRRR